MLPFNIKIAFLNINEGIYFFIAIMCGVIYFIHTCKKDNIDLDVIFEGVMYSFISAIIFGRLLSFVLWSPETLLKHPLDLINISKGGLYGFTVTGAVLGALVTGYIFLRIKKLHFFFHVKYAVPAILIGQVVGRFGCFLNGDAAGITTTLPWGVVFSPNSAAYAGMIITNSNFPALHPTQLYEILGNFLLLIFIIFTGKNEWITNRRIVFYAMGYGLIRFVVEFFRGDSVRILNYFTTGQIISAVGILIGACIIIWSIFNDDKMKAREENIAYKKIK
jgi:phosphatidylglycerol:prolipoprotein diacylglycerol transferase